MAHNPPSSPWSPPRYDAAPTAVVLRQEVPEQRSRLSGGPGSVITSWAERAMRAVRRVRGVIIERRAPAASAAAGGPSPRSSRCPICSSRAPVSSRRRPTWATEAADQCGGSPTGSPGATVTLRRHVLPHGRWHDDRGGPNPTAGTTWSTGRSRSGSSDPSCHLAERIRMMSAWVGARIVGHHRRLVREAEDHRAAVGEAGDLAVRRSRGQSRWMGAWHRTPRTPDQRRTMA